jgi:hypothetical protein
MQKKSVYKKFLSFCMLFFTNTLFSLDNKIVFLISPPRNCSTIFLRMMQARGDFQVMHEPSLALDNLELKKPGVDFFGLIKEKIFNKAQTSNVFVKEISQWVKDSFLNDQDLVARKNVYFVFLVRNPHHATISLAKKRKPEEIEQGIISKFAAYEALYEIFNHVKKYSVNKPCIIQAEYLYTDVAACNKKLCTFLGVPYLENALSWEKLGANFSGAAWDNVSRDRMAWHQEVINSTQIQVPVQYKTDMQGIPTFEEISSDKMRQECVKAYEESLVFYRKILSESVYFLENIVC